MNADIPGRYIYEKARSQYLELKPDGTYSLFEGSSNVRGTYKVNGVEITLLTVGSTSVARIEGNVVTDEEGDKWVRAEPVPPWLSDLLQRNLPWELFEAIGWAVILVLLLI
jgi:hypothetical protein